MSIELVTALVAVLGVVATAALGIGSWALMKISKDGERIAGMEARMAAGDQRFNEILQRLDSMQELLNKVLMHRRHEDTRIG